MKKSLFERLSDWAVQWAGSAAGFFAALFIVLSWLVSGPVFKYSSFWFSLMSAITSIITFLMVFLIQKSQNKESKSVQLKLNELISVSSKASNRLVSVEDLAEEELNELYEHYSKMAAITKEKSTFLRSISIEHAIERAAEEDIQSVNPDSI